MQLDMDAMATEVVLLVATALTPVLERLAAAEARLAALGDVRDRVVGLETKALVAPVVTHQLVAAPVVHAEPVAPVDLSPLLERLSANEARLSDIGDLRDRVVTMEAKAVSQPAPVVVPTAVDLTPVWERLAAGDARVATLVDLHDRVVAVEAKALAPIAVVDVAPLQERIALAEAAQATTAAVIAAAATDLMVMRDRVVTLETKAALPVVMPEPVPVDLLPLVERIATLEAKAGDIAPIVAAVADLTKDAAGLRERIAVAEVRQLVPGPTGRDGADGINGKDGAAGLHGKDGADGIGFEDLAVTFDGDRTLSLVFAKGLQEKSFPIVLPFLRYQGVYQEGKSYAAGDVCTWAGASWHANDPTTTKPGTTKAWTLMVKGGRDGKNGVDAPGALPVVSVR